MTGSPPLNGIKVIEFAGLAPGPYAGMLLADAGASVLRIDRAVPGATHTPGEQPPPTNDLLCRRKRSIAVDLKDPRGVALVRELASRCDVLVDPFRPGVLERLGLGPDALCARNPGLVYARMTGFRRDGRYAAMAGHDINYLAVSGVLGLLGREGERPHAPWNLLADFAGGGASLFQGILLALLARGATGRGQVVEANMVDGASHLATFPRQALKTPMGDRGRGRNVLDGGCPWYDTYETADGRHVSVGALEPQFFRELLRGLGLGANGGGEGDWDAENRWDVARWPELRALFAGKFRARTRAEWEAVFDGTDACCLPVLDYAELETDSSREGDQRPAVALHGTPCLAVAGDSGSGSARPPEQAGVLGQGPGVPGQGYEGRALGAGEGGEEALQEWVGWSRGSEYDVSEGGLVWKEAAASKL